MGAAGSPYGHFQRAVERGNVPVALAAAKDLGGLSLEAALELTEMFARVGDQRFEPAAVRWLARSAAERPLSLSAVRLAVDALAALPDASAYAALRALLRVS